MDCVRGALAIQGAVVEGEAGGNGHDEGPPVQGVLAERPLEVLRRSCCRTRRCIFLKSPSPSRLTTVVCSKTPPGAPPANASCRAPASLGTVGIPAVDTAPAIARAACSAVLDVDLMPRARPWVMNAPIS